MANAGKPNNGGTEGRWRRESEDLGSRFRTRLGKRTCGGRDAPELALVDAELVHLSEGPLAFALPLRTSSTQCTVLRSRSCVRV